MIRVEVVEMKRSGWIWEIFFIQNGLRFVNVLNELMNKIINEQLLKWGDLRG